MKYRIVITLLLLGAAALGVYLGDDSTPARPTTSRPADNGYKF